MEIKITSTDVGKKVRLKSGETQKITRFDENDKSLPVHITGKGWYSANGVYCLSEGSDNSLDVAEVIGQQVSIEAGKYYRVKCGSKGFCVGQISDGRFLLECLNGGLRGHDSVVFIDAEGKNTTGNSGWDIVAEWVEPKRIKGWINLYKSEGINDKGDFWVCGPYGDESYAREIAGSNLVACLEVDGFEVERR